MDPRVEEILMAKIASDNAAVPTGEANAESGATTGAALGGRANWIGGTPGGLLKTTC